jgi:hypothetical protein
VNNYKQNNGNTADLVEEILELSLEKFRWKTTGQIDKIANLFDDGLLFVHITGHITSKAEWIKQLKNKSFVYNKIEPQEHHAQTYGNTAVLVGKAWFTVNGVAFINWFILKFTQRKTKIGN